MDIDEQLQKAAESLAMARDDLQAILAPCKCTDAIIAMELIQQISATQSKLGQFASARIADRGGR